MAKKKKKKKNRRSQYWTKTGKKRLLKRDKKGRITDNQSYKKTREGAIEGRHRKAKRG